MYTFMGSWEIGSILQVKLIFVSISPPFQKHTKHAYTPESSVFLVMRILPTHKVYILESDTYIATTYLDILTDDNWITFPETYTLPQFEDHFPNIPN